MLNNHFLNNFLIYDNNQNNTKMEDNLQIQTINLKNQFTKRVNFGHLWIFSNELVNVPNLENGCIVKVEDESGKSYGYAFYNPNSLITCRLLLTNKFPDSELFINRIKDAYNKRLKYINTKISNSYRVVFGESDLLPGLVVDKFADYLCIQILSSGMEKYRDIIISSLIEVLPSIKGIYEKSDSHTRKLEGLEEKVGAIYGDIPEYIEIIENDLKYSISFIKGQKTGYFLDQKLNREFISKISDGLDVLDCYTNLGGFIINAAKGNSKSSTALDISKDAISMAKQNAILNGFDNIDFVVDDVPNFLKKSFDLNKKWDLIILDPPSFAKNRKSIPMAKHAYSKINRLAMKLLNDKGILVSSSCTKHIEEELLLDIILREAQKQNLRFTLIYRGSQPPDHPYLINMSETNYLKFFVFQLL